MGDRDGVDGKLVVPVAHPRLHRGVALAARRRDGPFVGLAPGETVRGRAPASPSASNLPIRRRRSRAAGRRSHSRAAAGSACRAPAPWSRAPAPSGLATNGSESLSRPSRANRPARTPPTCGRLPAAEIVQRDVLRALQPADRVPLGLAVADVVEGRPGHGLLGLSPSPAKYPARPAASCRRRDSRNRRGAPRR